MRCIPPRPLSRRLFVLTPVLGSAVALAGFMQGLRNLAGTGAPVVGPHRLARECHQAWQVQEAWEGAAWVRLVKNGRIGRGVKPGSAGDLYRVPPDRRRLSLTSPAVRRAATVER